MSVLKISCIIMCHCNLSLSCELCFQLLEVVEIMRVVLSLDYICDSRTVGFQIKHFELILY